jgi:hypothetical protein
MLVGPGPSSWVATVGTPGDGVTQLSRQTGRKSVLDQWPVNWADQRRDWLGPHHIRWGVGILDRP